MARKIHTCWYRIQCIQLHVSVWCSLAHIYLKIMKAQRLRSMDTLDNQFFVPFLHIIYWTMFSLSRTMRFNTVELFAVWSRKRKVLYRQIKDHWAFKVQYSYYHWHNTAPYIRNISRKLNRSNNINEIKFHFEAEQLYLTIKSFIQTVFVLLYFLNLNFQMTHTMQYFYLIVNMRVYLVYLLCFLLYFKFSHKFIKVFTTNSKREYLFEKKLKFQLKS